MFPGERNEQCLTQTDIRRDRVTTTAGQPWAGRQFEANASAADDGLAPAELLEALRRFQARDVGEESVIDAIRTSRLLIPLVTALGEAGTNDHGVMIDKTQELSIITVAGPDGRDVLPAFTSAAAMTACTCSRLLTLKAGIP